MKPSLPRAIWTLGFVSLLMDVSSEAVHGLLPVFLVSVLGASFTTVGFIEGFGEAAVLVLKVFSGPLSDGWGRRKPLVLLGYGMGAISKPFFAMAPTPAFVLGARLFDRTGKGIRGAPRDALIADLAPAELRGEAYGLRQSLDTVGAFLGPLLAIVIMYLSGGIYRLVFWVAVLPGVLCLLLIFFGIEEPENPTRADKPRLSLAAIRDLRPAFWLFSLAGAVFQLARFSEAFLILRAKDLGLPITYAPLVLVLMNVVYAVAAYPVGKLSDRYPRWVMILSGFLTLALADFILSQAHDLGLMALGVVIWGLHLGLSQGTLAALVADHSPAEIRGTAFGIFNLFSALALLVASAVAGYVWDHFGPPMTFLASGAVAVMGCALFLMMEKANAGTRRN